MVNFFPRIQKRAHIFDFDLTFFLQFDPENRVFAIFGISLGTFLQVKIRKIFAPPFLFSFFLAVSGRA